MLITRGFGLNTGSGGTGEKEYVYAPDPVVTSERVGNMDIFIESTSPEISVSTSLTLKPILSNNIEDTNLKIVLIRPSMYIKEE